MKKKKDISDFVGLLIALFVVAIVVSYAVFIMSRVDMTLWQKLMLLKG